MGFCVLNKPFSQQSESACDRPLLALCCAGMAAPSTSRVKTGQGWFLGRSRRSRSNFSPVKILTLFAGGSIQQVLAWPPLLTIRVSPPTLTYKAVSAALHLCLSSICLMGSIFTCIRHLSNLPQDRRDLSLQIRTGTDSLLDLQVTKPMILVSNNYGKQVSHTRHTVYRPWLVEYNHR